MKKYEPSDPGEQSGATPGGSIATFGNGRQSPEENMQGSSREPSPERVRSAISVIIPAYNEETAVGAQVVSVRDTLCSFGVSHEIIVVDDGSVDGTAEKAIEAGARVLQKPQNQGYGAAIKTGIVAAANDIIVIMDADGTYPADQIPHLIRKLETADMVVGARTGSDVTIPLVRRPAKWFLGLLANRVSGTSIPDLNSGLRSFRRDCVRQYFPILSDKFSFTTTVTLALLADGYGVVYHPINYFRRLGKSKITPRNFFDFIILVLRMAMLFQPLKIFVPLAFTCTALGVLKAIADIATVYTRIAVVDISTMQQPMLSISAVFLMLGGLHILLIGMVADGVLRRIGQDNRRLSPSYAVRSYELRAKAQNYQNDHLSREAPK